ncbi:GNAT family N-acetyltransferase [Kitasatospora cinereorecta]|uniref:GNAT family N-acetyltransferase n=1 Tax=Kitasatospora cinereorecta TaxID=285560 RepID=A0ABW0VHB1_9ACTN
MTPQHAGLSVRPLAAEEWEHWYRQLEIAFGGAEEEPEEKALWRGLTEVERSLAICAGEEAVGGGGAFSFRMAVPGGAVVPAAGVTMVGVLPTHRRRGALTALMRRQLDDIRARGEEAVAVLTASEPPIYGRFGYGAGTRRMTVTLPRGRVTVHTPAGPAVRLRLADPAEALPACEELYAQLVPLRPGMLERRPGWEQLVLLDAPGSRGGFSALQCVLAEDAADGRLLGYARYAVKSEWDDAGPSGVVRVRDVEALDPSVYARLWSYLLDLDLTSKVTVRSRPSDDPVLHLVSDPRRIEPKLLDGLFVRLVDVAAALEQRGYGDPLDVVLEVTDAFCPWNTGRWRLSSGGPGKGASCVRTADPADLRLDVRELGSAYLGGTTLAALARAGLVEEVRAGALREASRAFASDLAPWLPHGF